MGRTTPTWTLKIIQHIPVIPTLEEYFFPLASTPAHPDSGFLSITNWSFLFFGDTSSPQAPDVGVTQG